MLSSTPSPSPATTATATAATAAAQLGQDSEADSPPKAQKLSDDLKEFDVVESEGVALTSNLAILAAEFTEAAPPDEDEEVDPFDEAFDQLAKESISRTALEDIEKDLLEGDLFDTSRADDVLKLASLTSIVNKKEDKEEVAITCILF